MMLYKKSILTVCLLVFMLFLAACSGSQTADGGTADDAHDVHWGYEGEGGPEHWGDLEPEFAVCGTGVEQSPIDITNAADVDLANIGFDYGETAVNILNNGHTIQVNYDEGSHIEVDGKTYNLLQFHFHTPSEHEIDDQLAAGEMHLVHQSADGDYAVVGVLINEGAENSAFVPVWDNLPDHETEAMVTGASVNAADLLPDTLTYNNYPGSFTTPPCTEGVNWMVLTNPVEMSADQIAAFSNIIGHNNRPAQPLGDRAIEEDSTN